MSITSLVLLVIAALVWLRMLWRVPLFAEANLAIGLMFLVFGFFAGTQSAPAFMTVGSFAFIGGAAVRVLNRHYGRDLLGGPPRLTGETSITMPESNSRRRRRRPRSS